MEYSVLMSVYHKEKPAYFKQSISSILNQTVPTNDFVLVCDGPLTSELEEVLSAAQQACSVLHIIRLKENEGLGNALNHGIRHCKNELVARMDSDDIAFPDRCEKQLRKFEQDPSLSIVSGIVAEFTVSPEVVDAQRIVPETHEQILAFAKKRSPFNHPCVMFRKSAVERAGGYQRIFLLEDYDLWIRMLLSGAKGYNLQEPILWMRAGSNLYKRRSGWKYVLSQKQLFDYMREHGFVSLPEYCCSLTTRALSAIAPNFIRRWVFKSKFRK